MRKIDRPRALGSRLALRDMRLRAGLTPGQLAERLGVTCHAIQAFEKGQRVVRKGWDFKLAEALGCSITDLRRAESAARSRRWRQAWAKLTDAPPRKLPPRGQGDAEE
jgi:transcriptional regulator with XRE-family HTH domain